MIKTEVIPDSTIVSAIIEGGFTDADVVAFRERIQTLAATTKSKPSVLMSLEGLDVSDITPAGVWQDLKSAKILDDLDKVAVITDGGWIDTVYKVASKLSPLSVETFTHDQRENAISWLRE